MKWKVILALVLMSAVAACGTKSDLSPPGGKPLSHKDKNPSQPPAPLGQ